MTVVIAMDIFPRRRVASRKDISIGAAYCTLSLGICTSFKSAAQEAEQYRNNITRAPINSPTFVYRECFTFCFAVSFFFLSSYILDRSLPASNTNLLYHYSTDNTR